MSKITIQAALLLAAFTAPAFANPTLPAEQMANVRVYYGDLDLSDPAAIQSFERRIANAVEAACPSDEGLRDVTRVREIAQCRTAKRAEIAPLRETALAAARIPNTNLAAAR